ncbi:hypothetical protein [Brucella thiophenivorans]|uniref:hypothetical protein n=1 Tax=Brucella thiophenivorans TaxID=571255 RepID=UPI0035BBE931
MCWNYLYLETRLRAADAETHAEMMKTIKAHSPQSWAHINMLGEYDFSDKTLADSFGILPLKKTLETRPPLEEQNSSNKPRLQCLGRNPMSHSVPLRGRTPLCFNDIFGLLDDK